MIGSYLWRLDVMQEIALKLPGIRWKYPERVKSLKTLSGMQEKLIFQPADIVE